MCLFKGGGGAEQTQPFWLFDTSIGLGIFVVKTKQEHALLFSCGCFTKGIQYHKNNWEANNENTAEARSLQSLESVTHEKLSVMDKMTK